MSTISQDFIKALLDANKNANPSSKEVKMHASAQIGKSADQWNQLASLNTNKTQLEKDSKILDAVVKMENVMKALKPKLEITTTNYPYGPSYALTFDETEVTTVVEQKKNELQSELVKVEPALNDSDKARDRVVNLLKDIKNKTDNKETLLNSEMYSKMSSLLKLKPTSSSGIGMKTYKLPAATLSGGAIALSGEFEAYKNIFSLEKDSVKMIGGGNSSVWHPGLDVEATRRSVLFSQMLDAIEKELAANGKKLQTSDLQSIRDAIKALAKRESDTYGQLKTLQKYNQIQHKYKDTKDSAIKQDLDNLNVGPLVAKYFKSVGKLSKKEQKLSVVFSALMGNFM